MSASEALQPVEGSQADQVGEVQETKAYWVYILNCADGTFYTGITNDLERRLLQHQSGKGAKYVNARRRPVKIIYREGPLANKGMALRREIDIKRLSKSEKLSLVSNQANA